MFDANRYSLEDILSKPFQTQYETTLKIIKNIIKELDKKQQDIAADDLLNEAEKKLFEKYDFETIDTDILEKNVMTLFYSIGRFCRNADEYILTSWYSLCMNIVEKKKVKRIFELTSEESFSQLHEFFQGDDFKAFRKVIPGESPLEKFENNSKLKDWLVKNQQLVDELPDGELKKAIDDLLSPSGDKEKKLEEELNLPDLDYSLPFLIDIMDIQSENPKNDHSDIINLMSKLSPPSDIEKLKQALLSQQNLLFELVKRYPKNTFLLALQLESEGFSISADTLDDIIKDIESIQFKVAEALKKPLETEQREALKLLSDYFSQPNPRDIITGFSGFLNETPQITKIHDHSITWPIVKFFIKLYLYWFRDAAINILDEKLEGFKQSSECIASNSKPKA